MTGNKGFDRILTDFKERVLNEAATFQPGTESVSSRGGYYSSSPFLEAFFDITYNLAAYENRPSIVRPPLEFDNSRDRFAYCQSLAEEFEKAHPLRFGEDNYPTAEYLKKIYVAGGGCRAVSDEFGDDYILAIDAFCDRKFKERAER